MLEFTYYNTQKMYNLKNFLQFHYSLVAADGFITKVTKFPKNAFTNQINNRNINIGSVSMLSIFLSLNAFVNFI